MLGSFLSTFCVSFHPSLLHIPNCKSLNPKFVTYALCKIRYLKNRLHYNLNFMTHKSVACLRHAGDFNAHFFANSLLPWKKLFVKNFLPLLMRVDYELGQGWSIWKDVKLTIDQRRRCRRYSSHFLMRSVLRTTSWRRCQKLIFSTASTHESLWNFIHTLPI